MHWLGAALLTLHALPLAAAAQSVQLAGTMGGKALLLIDGKPRTLAVGESHAGVKLLSAKEGQAQVDRNGVVTSLRMGDAPAAVGGGVAPNPSAREIVMTAGPGGHFVTQGMVNGRPMQFMVDTGATVIALSEADADRLGLDWRSGQRSVTHTANGAVTTHRITLSAVKVGEITVSNVAAAVVPAPMPFALLGNSFLSRFQMRRDNDVMRLELKP